MTILWELSPVQIMTFQKQLYDVEYFNYLCSMINDARCTREIKPRIAIAKAAFHRKKTFQLQIGLKFEE